ncbi:MAG: trigger factor [Anaerolineales bacterium]|uniref:trigger factor n=1 Tax=Candidatus Villigracilis vicinus TaxID=3140679 RepID=UPI0031360769|nr:trigger factor [Anaerolineales bacterium]
MNIEKQIQEDHTVKLVVEVDQEKMGSYKKRAAAKISERGNISGFRPGKAPYHIVARTYGEAAIMEQAVDLFIDAEYSNILKEADVNPGASGNLENIESMDPPKFIFSVPLAPEIDLGDYTAVRLPYEWQAPEQKDVDAALEDLRQMYASTETVERAIESGDYVLLDVSSETTELNRTGFATFVRKEERDTEWPYNGFANELIGLKAGENKTIKHSFPKDWEVEELQGKDVEITATIKTVRGVTLPEVNDDFAKMTGAGETVDALMEALKKDVENRSQNEYDDKYFVDLIEKVKEGAALKYHEHTLEHEGEHVLQDLSQRLAQQGMDLDTYFKMRNTTREQFIESDVNPVAKKRLERGLILDEIVRKEQIQIDDEALNIEYNNALNNLVMQGMDLNKIRGGKKGQRELSQAIAMDAASRVMTRKALDMLKTIATGNYKPLEEREAEAKQAAEAAPAEEAGEEKAAE